MYVLTPKPKPLITKGVVSYSESCRARNTIRLKKEIIKEFNELKERGKDIIYKIEYHRNLSKLLRRIEEVKDNKEGIPFLLFIYSEREKGEV